PPDIHEETEMRCGEGYYQGAGAQDCQEAQAKSKAHDLYEVEHRGLVVAFFSIRRGSAKDLGHDYISKDLHISTGNARRLAQCPLSRNGYIALLRGQGLMPADHGDEPERG